MTGDWLVAPELAPETADAALAPVYEAAARGALVLPFCAACGTPLELEQYVCDACGATSSPMSPQPTKVAAAMQADLVFLASRNNTMKMAGVSLIAAATPTPMPAVPPRDTRQTSVRMRASRIRLIWPRNSVWYTGSSAIAAATRPATMILDGR